MEKRIYYGKNPPLSFLESIPFSLECPYKIRCKDFVNDDIAPPHCAGTMEIDVCCGITGEAVVENQAFPICGDAVVVVPPGAVHAVTVRAGPGRLYVLHISFEALQALVDVEKLLAMGGQSLQGLGWLCSAFAPIHQLVQEMIVQDGRPLARTRALLAILELIFAQEQEKLPTPRPTEDSEVLRRVLCWTELHFNQPVTLDEAARTAGFTKNYFCAWFKRNTGLTYNGYLNQVRVNHACQLLAQNRSIAAACYSSGFHDMSYFIQRFKSVQGVTPKAYLHNLTRADETAGAAGGEALRRIGSPAPAVPHGAYPQSGPGPD